VGAAFQFFTIIYTSWMSWNKLGELVIFGKLDELENFTKLVIFTNGPPSWNNEKTQPYRLGLF